MRSVSAAFQTALEADSTASLVTLVEIDTATPIRRALWPQDVVFGGVTYTADGGAHSEIRSDIEYNRPGMTLTLQNVEDASGSTLPWSTVLADGTINGVSVAFRVVSTALLSDASAVIQETDWTISGWSLEPNKAIFSLGSPHDALALEVPTRPIGAVTCALKYKQGACTSTSGKETCGKTLQDCRERFGDLLGLFTGIQLPIRMGPSFPFYPKNARRRR